MFQLRPTQLAYVFALSAVSPIIASTICSTVSDYAGLPLPGASLNATNLSTGKSFVARVDRSGHVCISGLSEGAFSVEASLTGFLNVRYYPVRSSPAAAVSLKFVLPFGEITEGGIGQESTLSGTLMDGDTPLRSTEICAVGNGGAPRLCATTNDLGEYALVLPAGVYQVEIGGTGGRKLRVDLSSPGIYMNRLPGGKGGAH